MFSRRKFIGMGVAGAVVVVAAPKILTKELDVFRGPVGAPVSEPLSALRNPVTKSLLDRTLFIALHTAAPVSGEQCEHEAKYAGYERQRVARNHESWELLRHVDGSPYIANRHAVVWPQSLQNTIAYISHFSVGGNISGCNHMLFWGQIDFGYSFPLGLPVTLGTQLKFDKRALRLSFE